MSKISEISELGGHCAAIARSRSGGQRELQLLRMISEVTLSEEQLNRISELRTSHQMGGGSAA